MDFLFYLKCIQGFKIFNFIFNRYFIISIKEIEECESNIFANNKFSESVTKTITLKSCLSSRSAKSSFHDNN